MVDDGSDDETYAAAVAQTDQLNGARLTVIRQDNKGAGYARNRALEEAGCGYVAFLDADDEWLPEKLEKSLAYLENDDFSFVAHNGWIIDGDRKEINDCARRFAENPNHFSSLYRKGYVDTCTVVARRQSIIDAGGFDIHLLNAQDFDLWLALAARPGARFAVFSDVLSRYHVMPRSNMSHTGRRLECCLKIVRRYMPELKQRKGFGLSSVWYRTLAVHNEAFAAYWRNGSRTMAFALALRIVFAFATMTVHYMFSRPDRRGNFFQYQGLDQ